MPLSVILISIVKGYTSWFNLWFHASKIEELKGHIQFVMWWEFENSKKYDRKAKKICSVYGQGLITDWQVQNWFSKFCLSDESRSGCFSDVNQDAFRELMECNPCKNTQELTSIHSNSQSTTTGNM